MDVTQPHGAMASRRFQTTYSLHFQGSASPESIPCSKRRYPSIKGRSATASYAPLTEPKNLQDGVQRVQKLPFI